MNKINDLLMDAYLTARCKNPCKARMLLGSAAALLRPIINNDPEFAAMYHNIHFIRDNLKEGSCDSNLEDISREVRRSYDLAA